MSGNTAEPSLDPPAEACTQANIRREEEILRLVSFAWKEGFPPSVKEKREYYINQVKQAAMHFQDKTKCLEAALCLYRAFKVWPGTYRQLVLHWCKLVPEPILEILGSMLAHDPSVGEKAMGEHLAIYVLHTGGPERRKVQNPPLTPNETFINALAVCEEAFPGLVPASVADVDTEK
ncbi:MAG: hypothetical protein M1829_006801 [Trizodia sp. TS-e1964]|nr:MAG: hypothetical protein M1829_006801 [Trizodia sp. TS-e1964]